jgi:hypothetical protein
VSWWRDVVKGCEKARREYEEYSKRPDADPHVLEALRRRVEWCRRYVGVA